MSSSAPSPRVASASRFLADPRVHLATVDQRVSFLREQGLSEAELWEAVQRVGTTADTAIANW